MNIFPCLFGGMGRWIGRRNALSFLPFGGENVPFWLFLVWPSPYVFQDIKLGYKSILSLFSICVSSRSAMAGSLGLRRCISVSVDFPSLSLSVSFQSLPSLVIH
jgi:hypothetical protein